MKTIVVYESKYGKTQKYAEWIAESLNCELYPRKSVRPEQLRQYDTIVYGGGLYAEKVLGIRLLVDNYETIRDKNFVIFTCGLMDPTSEQYVATLHKGLAQVLPHEMFEKAAFFHFRGGIDYANLNFIFRLMMKMFYALLKKKQETDLTNEDMEIINSYGKSVDYTDRATTKPLLDYIASL